MKRKYIKDAEGKFYPVTSGDAVLLPDGKTVNEHIANLEEGGGANNTSITYTKEEWDALSAEEKETVKQTYDTVYITGDVSDWCEKPSVETSYPSSNIPKDNTIYELGERTELTIAGVEEHSCASISVVADSEGMTLGIAEGIKVIGSIPTIEGGKEYFVGIADGKVYVEEVSVYTTTESTEEGA